VSGPGGASRAGQASHGTASPDPAILAGPDPSHPSHPSHPGQASGAGPARRSRGRPGGPRGPRRRWRAVLIALAVMGVAGAMAWVLLGSRLLVVRSVIVTGTQLVPKSEVLAVAGIRPGTPLIRVNTAQVAARVETIRQVQSAQVTRSWPDRVVIAVRERTAAFAVAAPGGGFDLVDAHGVLVRWAARRPPGLPLYLTPDAVASLRGDPDFGAASAVLGELPAQLRRSLQSVTAPSPYQVTLRLAGGVTVLWGGTDRPAAKAEVLAVLMRTHARYYDVSAPGTAVTK
jgi:cell division protein FtsQ